MCGVKFDSVGAVGKQFLRAASTQRLPVMIIPNQEMLEEESKKGNAADNKVVSSDKEETVSNYLMQSMLEVILHSIH